MAELISEEQFDCSVCLEILKEPVTIPCGHSFCTGCIKKVWDQAEGTAAAATGSYSCPQCRALFSPRPVLGRNIMLAEVVEKLRKSPRGGGEGLKPGPAAAGSGGEEVPCDFCTGTHSKALKSCLVCLASYCETHLQPHRDKAAFKWHKLVDPVGNLEEKLCETHGKMLDQFCRRDQTCICTLCREEKHQNHMTVSVETERPVKQEQLGERQAEIHKRIQERLKELEELKQAVESLKSSARRETEESQQIFTQLIRSIQQKQAEVTALIAEKEKAAVSQAEERMEQLVQEITELKRRDAEMEQLSKTEDHIHFLKNYQSLCESSYLPSVTVNTDVTFEAVRKAVSELKGKLEDIWKIEFVSITKTVNRVSCLREPKNRAEFLKYSRQLTLDPNTVHRELRLSEGNRKVTREGEPLPYPDHPERFESEFQVLCTEGLSGTRCYWEIKWSVGVEIGVTYKGISRKGGSVSCQLGRNDMSWSLYCATSHSAWHNNKEIKITAPSSSRIGVYLNCPAGTLSFYSVSPDDKMTLLHRFHTTFTEPLYPGFRLSFYCWGQKPFGSCLGLVTQPGTITKRLK
ncbi:tripartite motif-containing protein 16-like [Acipenser ruthenus]|uniref:tripartite motif-containing protein 16-like n=1 Tax=Acipenser ruthenus TaxID=7906 RepID=UPI002741C097|nr:tripartite motif-containing protein 16-like [Acipenser ruthenus]